MLRMKFACSAALVTGKPLVSSESATWLNEHTLATLGDVKQAVDKFFLGGVNHICYHGTPFSPEGEEWPGWLFYAAVHFGPTTSFWNDFSALNHYVARGQSFLQAGKPDNDVLLYYPIHDDWSKAPQTARSMLPHYGGGIESSLGQADGHSLLDAGYSYDLVSDRQLRDISTASGSERGSRRRLLVGATLATARGTDSGGASYKAIILPETRFISPGIFERLVELARRGATVVVRNHLPSDVSGFGNLDARRANLRKLISQIKFVKADNSEIQSARVGAGRFLLGSDLKRLLAFAGV